MSIGVRSYSVFTLIRKWVRNLRTRNLAEGTRRNYAEALRYFLRYLTFRKLEVHEVTWETLEDWVVHMQDEELTTSTIKGRLSAVSGFFRIACRYKILQQNPRDLLDPMKNERGIPRPMSEAQAVQLLDQAVKPRDRALLEFFYATGCRAREACKVDLVDVELGVPQVYFHGKGRKERLNPLTSAAAAAIASWLPERARILKARGREHETALWVSNYGLRLSYHRVYWTFKNLAPRAALDAATLSPHVMRHTFCTHLLDGDADIRHIQVLAGHERLESTQIYTAVAQKKLREVFNKAHPRAGAVPPPETLER